MYEINMEQKLDKKVILTIIVAALGYFVDIYDLLLFSIVRVSSLKDIGVPEADLLSKGVFLINIQMLGLLIGGLIWGAVGDIKGRLSVLFGSIFLYSTANIANSFVSSVETYAIWRFIAGIGLAGELGAGITLVSEILPKNKRGIGTTIVASVGILGAVVGGLIGDLTHWRTAYLIGGVLGFSLLALRVGVAESHLFDQIKDKATKKGNLFLLFASRKNFFKYLRCILIGVPIWFVIGILITFSPEFSQSMGMSDLAKAGHAVMWSYLGLSLGDLASGLLSQFFKSRRKAVFLFLHLTVLTSFTYLQLDSPTLSQFYFVCALLGFATGYWAVFVTISAEQFGTNIRSTVATTVPNFVRGSVIPLTFCFELFQKQTELKTAALMVGAVSLTFAYLATWKMEETFHKDLNYLE
ncbi:MFS transporter [bacterium]|nr:MFS transporter [bacterium]